MKNRKNAVVTIEEIKEFIDRRSLESQINEGFDDQQDMLGWLFSGAGRC